MKPDWKDAPDWANWMAMDADKFWHWFESEPMLVRGGWSCMGGRFMSASDTDVWKESKEYRP